MKMNSVFLLMLALMTGCASYQQTRTPENLYRQHFSQDYTTVYRIIDAGMKEQCGLPPRMLNSVIYPDTETAIITQESNGIVAWSVDLKKTEDGGTDVDFYTTFKAASRNYPTLFKGWVEGKSGCYPEKM